MRHLQTQDLAPYPLCPGHSLDCEQGSHLARLSVGTDNGEPGPQFEIISEPLGGEMGLGHSIFLPEASNTFKNIYI